MRKLHDLSTSAYLTTLMMLAIVIMPAALTLHTIRAGVADPRVADTASRYGYTVSLLLFIVPSAAIVFWFMSQEALKISKRAFGWTVALLFPLGAALDFFFARYFFVFPNVAATLGVKAPALGNWVPVEEYIFYLTGFVTAVLIYIWLDEYWLAAYSITATAEERVTFDQLVKFHPASMVLALFLIVAAMIYRKYFVSAVGFPGYFIFLVVVALMPSTALLPMARPVINWRALSLTLFMMLVTSLLWEVTLAVPYGWWNFRDEQMLGIRITAWSNLPVEEIYVWTGVTYSSVILYEM